MTQAIKQTRLSRLPRVKPLVAALMSLLLGGGFAQAAPIGANALPQNGSYLRGAGSITQSGSAATVNTSSALGGVAVINWAGGFNVGSASTVTFNNGTGGATLNAINLDSAGAMSRVNGQVIGSGPGMNIVIVNPNGVSLGDGARVSTTGAFAAIAGQIQPSTISASGAGSVNVVLTSAPVLIAKSVAAQSQGQGALAFGPSSSMRMQASGSASLPAVIGSADLRVEGSGAALKGEGALASGGSSYQLIAEVVSHC